MRRYRATGVLIGINQWSQCSRAFKPGIQVESQFTCEGQIGPLTCGCNNPVNRSDLSDSVCRLALDNQLTIQPVNRMDGKTGNQIDLAAFHQLSHISSKLAAGGKTVSVAAAIDSDQIRTARCPNKSGVWRLFPQFDKIEQRISGRVSRADNQGRAALVQGPIAAENVGNAISNLRGMFRFTFRCYPACPKRIRRCPCARGVNDRSYLVAARAPFRLDNE